MCRAWRQGWLGLCPPIACCPAIRMATYHKRSNVESTFSAIKRKFGAAVRSKRFTAQVNEILCKVLCHNLSCLVHAMRELGIEPSFLGKMVA